MHAWALFRETMVHVTCNPYRTIIMPYRYVHVHDCVSSMHCTCTSNIKHWKIVKAVAAKAWRLNTTSLSWTGLTPAGYR